MHSLSRVNLSRGLIFVIDIRSIVNSRCKLHQLLMPRLLLLLVSVLFSSGIFAQVSPVGPGNGRGHRERSVDGACPILYFGFSTGINNSLGLFGPQVDVAFTESFSAATGFGLSSWGYKFFGEGRFYFDDCNRGWALGAGLTYNTGIEDLLLKDQETRGGRANIPVRLHPQTNIMLSGYRFFNLGKRYNRFYIQVGASIPTSRKKFTQLDGPTLTGSPTESLKSASPGGLIVALGILFGAR